MPALSRVPAYCGENPLCSISCCARMFAIGVSGCVPVHKTTCFSIHSMHEQLNSSCKPPFDVCIRRQTCVWWTCIHIQCTYTCTVLLWVISYSVCVWERGRYVFNGAWHKVVASYMFLARALRNRLRVCTCTYICSICNRKWWYLIIHT